MSFFSDRSRKSSMATYGIKDFIVTVTLGEAPTTYMNWRQPLTAFGGKTGFEIAEEAFLRHVSQLVITSFKVAPEGSDYDSFAYTLVHSTVGEDTVGGDFFENIPRECLSVQ